MTWYVGLTDEPERRRVEHGNLLDWKQTKFATEAEARAWEAKYVGQPGYQGGPGGLALWILVHHHSSNQTIS